jgi:acyl-coenzyme A synthetase/AMP-(fatty) acid ligase
MCQPVIPRYDAVHPPPNEFHVIFTSGSTGLPKGVSIDNTAMDLHVASIQKLWNLSCHDRVAIAQHPVWDGSDCLAHTAIRMGASVATIPLGPDNFFDHYFFIQSLWASKSTVLLASPLVIMTILNNQRFWGYLEHIRLISIGGDVVDVGGIDREAWISHPCTRKIELLHVYGPTEACNIMMAHKITVDELGKTVPCSSRRWTSSPSPATSRLSLETCFD